MTSRLLRALVASVALALAGCGSSSKSPSTPSNSTSTATSGTSASAFLSQLDALCVRANTAYSNASGVKAQAAVVAHYVATFHSMTPPPQLRALYSHYVNVLELESAALRAGNRAGLNQLVTTRARPLAEKLGAKGCVT